MLPGGDEELLQILDVALAETACRSGDWLACRPGCTQCCTGVFAISQLDAARLRVGLSELANIDAGRVTSIRERAQESVARLAAGFPGDISTGVLGASEEDLAAFDDLGNDEVCPALNPSTGLCEVYAFRPLACRTFGPPLRTAEGLGVCELCYHGATPEQVAACALSVDPDTLEAPVLDEFEKASALRGQTLVAFALVREDS